MTIITHALCGVTVSKILGYPYWIGIIFSIIPDIDHLILLKRIPKNLKPNSFASLRSPFHEFVGIIIVSLLSVVLIMLNFYPNLVKFFLLCYILHLFCDFLIGESYPFKYLNSEFKHTRISYLGESYIEKIIIELLFISFLFVILQI